MGDDGKPVIIELDGKQEYAFENDEVKAFFLEETKAFDARKFHLIL